LQRIISTITTRNLWLSSPLFSVLGFALLVACTPGPNDVAVCAALRQQRSGVEVIADGTVAYVPTYAAPSGEHEGFFIRLRSGCAATLRVETNTAFTGPIPLRVGERVIVKGEFDYDADGGVIHWTHRAFGSHHASGYVEAGGRFYW
jgi:hypothetical protein